MGQAPGGSLAWAIFSAVLLVVSCIIMLFAWYFHLRYADKWSMQFAILVSWLIAGFEYCVMIPANRESDRSAARWTEPSAASRDCRDCNPRIVHRLPKAGAQSPAHLESRRWLLIRPFRGADRAGWPVQRARVSRGRRRHCHAPIWDVLA